MQEKNLKYGCLCSRLRPKLKVDHSLPNEDLLDRFPESPTTPQSVRVTLQTASNGVVYLV
ncbi:MAG: hypothetical protein ACFFBD_16095 [Candidatus Hodarchaeota archaeon]